MSSNSIPVSLGKPSLRRRLEAYYSLIAPDQIANQEEWLGKFDKIAAKFGGSYDGERKLARKLEAKYGSTVRLLLAESVESNNNNPKVVTPILQRDESWYQLTEQETNSGVLDFTSSSFDPVAALLQASEEAVMEANPFLLNCSRMDRIDQCRSRLPDTDPLHRPPMVVRTPATTGSISASGNGPSAKKPSSLFAPLLESIDSKGPFIVLHRALNERKRVRVVIRYVNGIRGTLTGHIVAFDKHMNLLLRDALEVYSLRHTERTYDSTNLEQELKRREQPVRQHQAPSGSITIATITIDSAPLTVDSPALALTGAVQLTEWTFSAKSHPFTPWRVGDHLREHEGWITTYGLPVRNAVPRLPRSRQTY